MIVHTRRFGHRLGMIVEFEPSWFSEFTSAIGILLWSVAAFSSGAFIISGASWCLPIAGLVFGPFRGILLFRLTPLPRVLAASAGFVWWASLAWSMHAIYGTVPAAGAFVAIAIGDMLTVTKFSLAALRREGPGDSA